MWTAFVVMLCPFPNNPVQVALAERNQKIEAFAADGPDKSLAKSVAFGRTDRRLEHSQARAF